MWRLVSVGIFAFVLSLVMTPSGNFHTTGVRAAVTPILSTTASPGGPVNTTTLHDTATLSGGSAFTCPPEDLAARPVEETLVTTDLFCRYQTIPNDFFCKYFVNTGLLEQDHDSGFCPPVADPTAPPPTPAGTVIFNLYGPNDATCAGDSVFTSTKTLSDGTASSDFIAPAAPGVYRWTVSYSGDSNFSALPAACNGANESATITATPALATNASAGGPVGTVVNDTATLSGGTSPTGSITFTLKSPSNSVVYTDVVTVSGNGSYSTASGNNPGGYTTTVTGTYVWSATYSGDSGNNTATDNGQNESVVIAVVLPTPTISTVAGGTIVLGSGSQLTDSATLSGGSSPTGTITFTLKNPSNTVVYTDTVTVSGNGTYTTATGTNPGGYLPTVAGTYLWSASYSGDSNNNGAIDNGQNENETVSMASPAIDTVAGGTVVIGNGTKLTDSASLSGGSNPTGTITFTLKNPSSVAVYTNVVTVSGNGTYTTATGTNPGGYLPTVAGTYLWSASYSGDSNNNGAADNGQNENETVSLASPTISTQASVGGALGTSVNDVATIAGGASPSGTVSFMLFSDSSCGTQVFTSTNALAGATATSGSFTPATAGTYYWTAAYNGDAANSTATSTCLANNESVTITTLTPTISTHASQGGTIGAPGTLIHDTATVGGGSSPMGTVTFRLYSDSSCTAQVFTSTNPLAGGSATSGDYFPAIGTYYWTATYNGDANNSAVTSPCGAPGESVTVGDVCAAILRLIGWPYAPIGCPQTNRPPQRGGH